MKFNPGDWSEALIGGAKGRIGSEEHDLGDYEPAMAARVMTTAQEWVSRYTVVLGNAGLAEESTDVQNIRPGSGVLVKLNSHTYGVLTAGHVLRRGENTKFSASVTIYAPPRSQRRGEDVVRIALSSRPCTVDGFYNESEEGPDIAVIPLANEEWRTLNASGMVAYNLQKDRWAGKEKEEFAKMNPWLLSIINGVRFEASQIIYGHSDGSRVSLAIVATNTQVNVLPDRGDYDYLELPSETTKHSHPTHWKNELPGTAQKEFEDLHDEGVTKRVWAGTSGAGVWNLVLGTTEGGLPNGRVLAQLAGICFFANSKKGCIVAHGTRSIAKIAARHEELEAVRYHTKA